MATRDLLRCQGASCDLLAVPAGAAGADIPARGAPGADVEGCSLVAWLARLPGRSGSAWLRRLAPATTRRCSSIQETSGLGRRAKDRPMDARNAPGRVGGDGGALGPP